MPARQSQVAVAAGMCGSVSASLYRLKVNRLRPYIGRGELKLRPAREQYQLRFCSATKPERFRSQHGSCSVALLVSLPPPHLGKLHQKIPGVPQDLASRLLLLILCGGGLQGAARSVITDHFESCAWCVAITTPCSPCSSAQGQRLCQSLQKGWHQRRPLASGTAALDSRPPLD